MLLIESISLKHLERDKHSVMLLAPGQIEMHSFPHVLLFLARFLEVQP
jgi:hypothetical protein